MGTRPSTGARSLGGRADGNNRRQSASHQASGAGDSGSTPPASSSGDVGSGLTRVTVNLNRQAVQALNAVSEATGYSKTDTINRALQIYAIISAIMDKSGGTLNIRHDNGEIERIHIV